MLNFESILTHPEFQAQYDSEEACVRALQHARWPDGFRCPRCQHTDASVLTTRKVPLYCCRNCKCQTSLIAGTIFERTRTPLRLWFQAIYLHTHPPGVSALKLSEILGVTYKTAWTISHKLRFAMSADREVAPLQDHVRINCDFYGYPLNHTSSRHPMEHPILAGCSVDESGSIQHVSIQQLIPEHLQGNTCQANRTGVSFFLENFVRSSDVQVTTVRYHRQHFRPLTVLCRQMRQWVNGIYHGIGAKHLQAYLDQFVYRWNQLGNDLLPSLLRKCASTKSIIYRTLIERPLHRPAIESDILQYVPKNRRHRYTVVRSEPNPMYRFGEHWQHTFNS